MDRNIPHDRHYPQDGLPLYLMLRIMRRRLEHEHPLLWAGLCGLGIAAAGWLFSIALLSLRGGL